MLPEYVWIKDLESVKAGESLQFDELWLPVAIFVCANPKVEYEEMAVSIFSRHPVLVGNGAFGELFESGV